MTVRKISIEKYTELIDVWNRAGLPIRSTGRDSYENLERQLASGRVVVFADKHEGNIRGLILLSHDERKGWINRLAVLPEYRRQGIATRLLKKAEEFFLSAGIEIFTTLIESDNVTSTQFFEKAGYKMLPDICYFSKRSKPDI
ncbi:MAG: GNAT family N-acetyltransferase [Candidatus Hodarchaeales archaeon]|jgi:GNAT superfamily N-acetyltransferase